MFLGVLAKSAVPTLIEFVKKGPVKDLKVDSLRGVSASVLGEIGDLEAVPCLLEALEDENYLCACATGALGKLGDRRAVLPLIDLLTDGDKSWVPRGAAAVALGDLGETAHEALPALQEALGYDCSGPDQTWDLRAREAVEDAIERITNSGAKSSLKGRGYRFEMWGIR